MISLSSGIDNWLKNQSGSINAKEVFTNKGFFSNRTYIAYNTANQQWSLVDLNIFQRLARNIFGCYKDTHLASVKGELEKIDTIREYKNVTDQVKPIYKEIFAKFSPRLFDPEAPIQAEHMGKLPKDCLNLILSHFDCHNPHLMQTSKKLYSLAKLAQVEEQSLDIETRKAHWQSFLKEALENKDFATIGSYLKNANTLPLVTHGQCFEIFTVALQNGETTLAAQVFSVIKKASSSSYEFSKTLQFEYSEKAFNLIKEETNTQNRQKLLHFFTESKLLLGNDDQAADKALAGSLSSLISEAIEKDSDEELKLLLKVFAWRKERTGNGYFNKDWVNKLADKGKLSIALQALESFNGPMVYQLFIMNRLDLFDAFLKQERSAGRLNREKIIEIVQEGTGTDKPEYKSLFSEVLKKFLPEEQSIYLNYEWNKIKQQQTAHINRTLNAFNY